MTHSALQTSALNLNQIARNVYRYFRRNPGAGFIVAFQVSLVIAASELILGNESLANDIGVYGFILLVVGVAFYAVSVIKPSKEA